MIEYIDLDLFVVICVVSVTQFHQIRSPIKKPFNNCREVDDWRVFR